MKDFSQEVFLRYTTCMWYGIIMICLFIAVPIYLIIKTRNQIKSGNGLRWLAVLSTVAGIVAVVRILFTGIPLWGSAESWVLPAVIACIVIPMIFWIIYLRSQK